MSNFVDSTGVLHTGFKKIWVVSIFNHLLSELFFHTGRQSLGLDLVMRDEEKAY